MSSTGGRPSANGRSSSGGRPPAGRWGSSTGGRPSSGDGCVEGGGRSTTDGQSGNFSNDRCGSNRNQQFQGNRRRYDNHDNRDRSHSK